MVQLQILDVSENQLTSLPDGICKLVKLTMLSAFKNQLKCLPKDMGQLQQLVEINIFNNKVGTTYPLTEFPLEEFSRSTCAITIAEPIVEIAPSLKPQAPSTTRCIPCTPILPHKSSLRTLFFSTS